jgi:hypothetical protein
VRILKTVVLALVGLAVVAWAGLRVPARPYPSISARATGSTTVPLPDDLPAPVARFYGQVHGDRLPVVETAVISGRGTMRVSGVTLPVRFRFTHAVGADYRHEIETTIYGLRFLEVDEAYLDGASKLVLPFAETVGPHTDQAANLGLWAETIWMPSVWVTDPRVRWEPVDEHTALLVVPFGHDEETFVARFEPATGLLRLLESMRFRTEGSDERTLWINEALAWGRVDGQLVPIRTTLTWLDDGSPWARLTTEEVVTNVELVGELDLRRPPFDGS